VRVADTSEALQFTAVFERLAARQQAALVSAESVARTPARDRCLSPVPDADVPAERGIPTAIRTSRRGLCASRLAWNAFKMQICALKRRASAAAPVIRGLTQDLAKVLRRSNFPCSWALAFVPRRRHTACTLLPSESLGGQSLATFLADRA